MRFVVLTNGGDYGYLLASMLKDAGIKPRIVITKSNKPSRDIRKYFLLRTVGRAVIGGNLNPRDPKDTKLEDVLKDIDPHYILLGAPKILRQNIIDTAKIAVVNAHPGLLPWFRGVDVVGRALQVGKPVGSTLHFVNSGIGTGDMILKELLEISPEWNLQKIEKEADTLSLEMLVDFAAVAERHPNDIPTGVSQFGKDSMKCTWLTPDERTELDTRIKEGLAYRLYIENKDETWWKI